LLSFYPRHAGNRLQAVRPVPQLAAVTIDMKAPLQLAAARNSAPLQSNNAARKKRRKKLFNNNGT
jgi:hypothetical protein